MSEPQYPHGKKYEDDEGELQIALRADHKCNCVRIDFQKPIKWFAMEPEIAIGFAKTIIEKVNELNEAKVAKK